MKSIGIKQADGTFYKILDEGTADTRHLVLTTVQDNQTTVQIDLYRSETDSMEDAEYVDTLQIKNLEPHPNGEPNLQLNVSIDENGELHAEVDDPETGKSSQIQVSLVTLTPEERSTDFEADAVIDDTLNLETISTDNEAEVNDMIGPSPNEEEFSFDTIESVTPVPEDIIPVSEEATSEPAIDLADFDTIPLPTDNSEIIEEPSVEIPAEEEPIFEETVLEEPSFDEPVAEETVLEEPAFEEPVIEEPSFEEPAAEETVLEESSFEEPVIEEPLIEESVFDEPVFDEPVTEDTAFENPSEETAEPETDISIPVFDEPADLGINSSVEDNVIEENASDIFDAEESIPDEIESEDFAEDTSSIFDLPDFPIENPPEEDSSDSLDLPDDFDLPSSESSEETPQASGLDFDDLYDEETLNGSSSYNYEEDTKRKTKTPVIICITCAVICIIAALLFLFVIPCKINCRSLFTKNKTETEETALIIEPEAVEENTEESVESIEQPAPVPVEAKEDEIVVAVVPEAVIPEQPAAPKEKPADIRYKIKWGDTLWDISNAYYKNPWRYKMLARYNGIKNPNLIISGKYIYIPAE